MSLKNAINNDAKSLLVNVSDFAEAVQYQPRQQYGKPARLPRTINAVVIRQSMQSVSEDGNETITPVYEVHVANDPVLGISSVELDTGGDKIAFPIRDGLNASPRTIMAITDQDHGMLVLECR
jgi:hypothetical protein